MIKNMFLSGLLRNCIIVNNYFQQPFRLGIALPHPIKNIAHKSVIFICILKKSFAWDTHKVSLIMIPMIE
ncbi:hypothetical protein D5Z92_14555 [Listeria monocytogenes]|nr:hypothetical protein [Listeria monocytogenes]